MPSDEGKRGNRFGAHRLMLEGFTWQIRTGAPTAGPTSGFRTVADGVEAASSMVLGRHLRRMLAQAAAVFGPIPGWPTRSRNLQRPSRSVTFATPRCGCAPKQLTQVYYEPRDSRIRALNRARTAWAFRMNPCAGPLVMTR